MIRWAALLFACATVFAITPATAKQSDAALRASLQRDLNQYLSSRSKIEHLSAISLSISLSGQPSNINLAAGRTQYGGAGVPVPASSLWQIGSNTKAFTAVLILELEAEGKLTIDQTIGKWLPQYPAWRSVTIRRLLNMSSGIPTYDYVPEMLRDYAKNPKRNFTIPELIAYVYPSNPAAPKPTTGYSYSNTNYLLAQLVIEKATHDSYANEIERRLFSALGLKDTYYNDFQYQQAVLARMPAGYFFDHGADSKPLAPLLGRDIRSDSVSWMQGAGGIVSTAQDLTRWARALYGTTLLPSKQRAELFSLISTKTGKPIAKTSAADPRGFGLGVVEVTAAKLGTFWFYQGETLGYRMVHFYLPRQDAVIAFGLNSAPDKNEDHAGELATRIYDTLHAAGRL
jgi:D-alanyl-D-alanine carboxypeptidase